MLMRVGDWGNSHYSSSYHTEAVLSFGAIYPDLFWEYLTEVGD